VASAEQAPAVRTCAALVNARREGEAGVMVSDWTADVRPVAATVTSTLPVAVPLNQRVAPEPPGAMVTAVAAVAQPASP
jgi:hypothetical protein